MHSIRVTDYCGDLDTLRELHVIFGYPSAGDRDDDLTRLASLPGMDGSVDIEQSDLPDGRGADLACHFSHMRAVADHQGFEDAMYTPGNSVPAQI